MCIRDSARLRRVALHENAPGKARRLPRNHLLQGVGKRVEDAREVIELDVMGLYPEQAVLQPADEPAQARIGREIVDERFRLDQRREAAPEILRRLEQEPIAGEKLAAAGLRNLAESILVLRQRL